MIFCILYSNLIPLSFDALVGNWFLFVCVVCVYERDTLKVGIQYDSIFELNSKKERNCLLIFDLSLGVASFTLLPLLSTAEDAFAALLPYLAIFVEHQLSAGITPHLVELIFQTVTGM